MKLHTPRTGGFYICLPLLLAFQANLVVVVVGRGRGHVRCLPKAVVFACCIVSCLGIGVVSKKGEIPLPRESETISNREMYIATLAPTNLLTRS